MTKAGDPYQELVASIVRALDPNADVQVGQWVEGPDGLLELDVEIRGNLDGVKKYIIVECKDWSRKIGIETVDALESKRKDIAADIALICSNSGFTSIALRKARWVGIGLVPALKTGDPRVRVVIEEEILTRKIKIEKCDTTFHFPSSAIKNNTPQGISDKEITYQGLPIVNWVNEVCLALVGANPLSTKIKANYNFHKSEIFFFSNIPLPVQGCDISLSYSTKWFSQIVTLNATSGMYDYLRRQVLLSIPGQYRIQGVDFDKWQPIDFVPNNNELQLGMSSNSSVISIALVDSIDIVKGVGVPQISSLVATESVQKN